MGDKNRRTKEKSWLRWDRIYCACQDTDECERKLSMVGLTAASFYWSAESCELPNPSDMFDNSDTSTSCRMLHSMQGFEDFSFIGLSSTELVAQRISCLTCERSSFKLGFPPTFSNRL